METGGGGEIAFHRLSPLADAEQTLKQPGDGSGKGRGCVLHPRAGLQIAAIPGSGAAFLASPGQGAADQMEPGRAAQEQRQQKRDDGQRLRELERRGVKDGRQSRQGNNGRENQIQGQRRQQPDQ